MARPPELITFQSLLSKKHSILFQIRCYQLLIYPCPLGIFPDRLKISKIIPIFKSDNASLVQNYRPISILPAISKIFERAVYNRIFQFLVDNDLLYKHQYGFRPGHSTSHALTNFVTKAASAIDCHKYLAGIFLDLSKAFDTLDHAILLSKLEALVLLEQPINGLPTIFVIDNSLSKLMTLNPMHHDKFVEYRKALY